MNENVFADINNENELFVKEDKITITESPSLVINETEVNSMPYIKALYEPKNCYLGADITSDNIASNNISQFEDLVGVEHSLYKTTMILGEKYPKEFILRCISKDKIPFITIYPNKNNPPYSDKLLLKSVNDLNEIKTPMFIEFMPVSSDANYNPEKYINYYKKAYSLFKASNKEIAFVWSVEISDVINSKSYYPSDEFLDWVSVKIKTNTVTTLVENNFIEKLNYFYSIYENTKPIFISDFGISHFSSLNMTYYIEEKSKYLVDFYRLIESDYPRIKGIIYKSENEFINKDGNILVKNNYSITDDLKLLKAYNKATSSNYFKIEKEK